jgi:hypothetical protein
MMRRALSSILVATVILVASACIDEPESEPEPEPESPRAPPEGTLVHEGECARVFRSFDGYLCQGTAKRLDARACLIRDYLGGKPDLQRVDLYVARTDAGLGDWCDQDGLGGCASGTVAYGAEDSMNHEIVHAVVSAINGHPAHSIIGEGLAHALEGRTHTLFEAPNLPTLLAFNSGRAHRGEATNFVGWMLMAHGPKVVMAMAHDVPLGSKRATFEAALSKHLGMSIDEIIEAYETETAWMYPEMPPLASPVLPEEWADGIEVTLECSEASTEGLTDEPHMWRTIDFAVDEPGVYLFGFDDVYAVWVEEVCEDPHFEQGHAPCEISGYWNFGFTYLQMALNPGRRYRARIEAFYPGPLNYTFLPMLGVDP